MKDDSIYIGHIIQSINNIFDYTKDLTKKDFAHNKLIQDAVIRNFEIIGEQQKKFLMTTGGITLKFHGKLYQECEIN